MTEKDDGAAEPENGGTTLPLLPPLLVALTVAAVGQARDGQLGTLVREVTLADGGLVLILCAVIFAVPAVVATDPPRRWRWAACVAAAAPALVLAWLVGGQSTAAAAVGACGALAALLVTSAALYVRLRRGWRVLSVLVFTIAVWAVLHVAVTVSPVEAARQMGTLTLGFVFVSLTALLLQCALMFPRIGGMVVLSAAVVFFWNEEPHVLQLKDLTEIGVLAEESERLLPSLQTALRAWILTRGDLNEHLERNNEYPMFLVTSEGGGGYAAAHAYLFLSKMQQRCPNFAQHIFAMVGVSGGAVGNTLFQTRLAGDTNPDAPQRCSGDVSSDEAIDLLSEDYLSPVIAALLYRDLPNKLTGGLFGPRDRVDAIIAAFAGDREAGSADNPLIYDNHL